MLFLTKYESNLIVHGFCPLLLQWGGVMGGGDLVWKFAICGRAELKTNGGVIFITILLHFYYFTFLETANIQKSEVFLLRISLGNVNASVVTYWYHKMYNFSFRKFFLEILSVYLSRILTTSSTTPFVKNSPTSCVSSL